MPRISLTFGTLRLSLTCFEPILAPRGFGSAARQCGRMTAWLHILKPRGNPPVVAIVGAVILSAFSGAQPPQPDVEGDQVGPDQVGEDDHLTGGVFP